MKNKKWTLGKNEPKRTQPVVSAVESFMVLASAQSRRSLLVSPTCLGVALAETEAFGGGGRRRELVEPILPAFYIRIPPPAIEF